MNLMEGTGESQYPFLILQRGKDKGEKCRLYFARLGRVKYFPLRRWLNLGSLGL